MGAQGDRPGPLVSLFPLWALAVSALAFLRPDWLVWARPAILPLLGVVMFGMGTTLSARDFADVLRRPRLVGLGLGLQYLVMPLAGWSVALGLGLSPELTAGMVLVGACPGGTASNLVTYLARGDVALSIGLTALSTLLAVPLTPALTWLLVGERVPVPAGEMLESIALIVLVPVALGVGVNALLGGRLEGVKGAFPLVSVAAILVIVGIVVALNRTSLATLGPLVALAVVLHNGLGLLAGYWGARVLGADEIRARTIAIEVGMQNSGLAVALAAKYFGAAAALPGAIFSVWHNLSGSLLAGWWARRSPAGVGEGPFSPQTNANEPE